MAVEPTVTVVRPRLPRWAVLGDRLADWLEEGVAARRPERTAAGALLRDLLLEELGALRACEQKKSP